MPNALPAVPTVAIVGGGFSGAAVAYHLAKLADAPIRIVVFEPRAEIGTGVAYSTQDPVHRINVPAARMSLLPDDQGHFVRWLATRSALDDDSCATLANGQSYPARRLFGRYVVEQLRPLLIDGRIEHHRVEIASIANDAGRWLLTPEGGEMLVADIIVIAISHPPPVPPAILAKAFGGEARFIANPWAIDALAPIRRDDQVLIVGTGLTMADAIATLDARGHRGSITAISRRGQRSHSHAPVQVEPFGDFVGQPSRTTLDLLRRVRSAARSGKPWQGLFDRLRVQAPDIWKALPPAERHRLIRHLRPFWDTHRFRISPHVAAVLDRRIEAGTLSIRAAAISAADMQDALFAVTSRERGGMEQLQTFDAVITTTGPGHGNILVSQSALATLAVSGLLMQDPTKLGIAVDDESRMIGRDGPTAYAFVAGPLARGTFGELMGLPEITNQARNVAEGVKAAVDVIRHPGARGSRR